MNSFWGSSYTNAFVPGLLAGWLSIFIIPLVIWSLFWKAMGLWKAARQDSKAWFIILLLVNTLGILEILYVFVFSKMGTKNVKKSRKATKS